MPQSFLIPAIGVLAVLLVVVLLYLWWTSAPAPSAQAGTPDRSTESQPDMLQIVREPGGGAVNIEYAGRRYRTLAEIIEPEVRDQVISMIRAASQLAEGATGPAAGAPQTFPAWLAPPTAAPVEPPPANKAPATAEIADLLAPLSVAEQIDEILQGLIVRQPDLAQRNIHIRTAMDGGVRIEVDGHSYDGVGDITDPEARTIIQTAIQEWETRNS